MFSIPDLQIGPGFYLNVGYIYIWNDHMCYNAIGMCLTIASCQCHMSFCSYSHRWIAYQTYIKMQMII